MSNRPNKNKPGLEQIKKNNSAPTDNQQPIKADSNLQKEVAVPNSGIGLGNKDNVNTMSSPSKISNVNNASKDISFFNKIGSSRVILVAVTVLLVLNLIGLAVVWRSVDSNKSNLESKFNAQISNLATAVGLNKNEEKPQENYQSASEIIEETKKSVVIVEKLVSAELMNQIRETVKNRFINRVEERDYISAMDVTKDYWEPLGSGIVVRQDGLIVTNKHVVAVNGQYRIRTSDGQVYPVRRVMVHPYEDIALLRASDADPEGKNKNSFKAIKFASTQPKAGDEVYSVGHPARLTYSVSKGLIANPDRNFSFEIDDYLSKVRIPDILEKAYFANSGQSSILPVFVNEGMSVGARIQHTSSINLGSSGGALIDTQGNLIGINTFAIEDPNYDTYNLVPNIDNPYKSVEKPEDLEKSVVQGYTPKADFNVNGAISADLVKKIVAQYEQSESTGKKMTVISIGAYVQHLTPSVSALYGYPVTSGERLVRLKDSLYGYDLAAIQENGPAQTSGLKENDIISAIDGKDIDANNNIGKLILDKKSGDKIKVKYYRQKADKTWESQEIELTLGEQVAFDEESLTGLKLGNISL
ncbi:MAG: hypothetical protein OHK0017_02840 [Patescibacteria group bacterium]